MDWMVNYLETLWLLTLEMAPWLLLGFGFAGLLKVFIPAEKILRLLGKKGWASNVRAAIAGVPLPLCSCGVIPTGMSLYKNGASQGATQSFLISTPQTGLDSIFATYAVMGWPIAVLRPLIAFVSGIIGGSVADSFLQEKTPRTFNRESATSKPLKERTPWKITKEILEYGYVEMMAEIAKWLVVGLLLAALISVVVPPEFIAENIDNMWLEFVLILAVSIPLYVCATGSIPIGMVLLLKGVSPGAVLLFLMAGPATNIATMTVIGNVMGRKSLVLYITSITLTAVGFAFLVNLLIPAEFIMQHIPSLNAGDTMMHSSPLHVALGLILLALLGNVLYRNFSHKAAAIEKVDIRLNVEGMTCQNCKRKVETELGKVRGVDAVKVDLEEKSVFVQGNCEVNRLEEKIIDIGFKLSKSN